MPPFSFQTESFQPMNILPYKGLTLTQEQCLWWMRILQTFMCLLCTWYAAGIPRHRRIRSDPPEYAADLKRTMSTVSHIVPKALMSCCTRITSHWLHSFNDSDETK